MLACEAATRPCVVPLQVVPSGNVSLDSRRAEWLSIRSFDQVRQSASSLRERASYTDRVHDRIWDAC
eukprot:3054462-Rhodomonas_salina.1